MIKAAARDGTAGGRIYDARIAQVARSAGAGAVVTDNRRHFLAALRHGIRVETPGEFLAARRGGADKPGPRIQATNGWVCPSNGHEDL